MGAGPFYARSAPRWFHQLSRRALRARRHGQIFVRNAIGPEVLTTVPRPPQRWQIGRDVALCGSLICVPFEKVVPVETSHKGSPCNSDRSQSLPSQGSHCPLADSDPPRKLAHGVTLVATNNLGRRRCGCSCRCWRAPAWFGCCGRHVAAPFLRSRGAAFFASIARATILADCESTPIAETVAR